MTSVHYDKTLAFPLSFAQQRLWLLEELLPSKGIYNIPVAFHFKGVIDKQAFRESLKRVINRHEILRVSFLLDTQDLPYQYVNKTVDVDLEFIDYSNVDQCTLILDRHMDKEAQHHFKLDSPPLFRCRILDFAHDEHILLFTVHHIIFDGWSMGIFFRELCHFYNGLLVEGHVRDLLPPVQYTDYSLWQKEWLQGEVLEEQLKYWKSTLKDSPEVTLFPTDFSRSKTLSYEGGTKLFSTDVSTFLSLQSLSRKYDSSIVLVCLSALYVLLYRYSGQSDLVVGIPVANRHHKEVEAVIGFFVNMLPFRIKMESNEPFSAFLKRVRDLFLDACERQDAPFEKIVDELKIVRSPNIHPLFQTMFEFQNSWDSSDVALYGLTVSPVRTKRSTTIFDFSLECYDENNQLYFNINYAKELYEPTTVERISHHYLQILKQIVANPDESIGELILLDEKERAKILIEWNDTRQEYPRQESFLSLFEKQVAITPHKVALKYDDSSLTYAELEAASANVAYRLIESGCQKGEIVGLFLERSLDFITAFIGIMRAGCVYLPLDSKQPQARLLQIVKESRLKWVWTNEQSRAELHSIASELIICTPGEATKQKLPILAPKDLAYVIYTSGSTGVPKGAMVEHQGMLNHMYAKIRDLQMTSEDILAQNAGSTFDISVWQMLTPLILGGQVRIYPDAIAKDPERLMQCADKHGVTVLELVPSMMHMILEIINIPLKRMRWIISTGEALTKLLAERWIQCYPKIPLMNAYGPTECSDDVTHYVIKSGEDIDQPIVPIGRPVQNTQIYILDEALRPVPIGVAGELYVGGDGVGKGYLYDEVKTNNAFIPNPFGRSKLYKTGDLARYLKDGRIIFLGRRDHQIKIRGHRIELGEIESILSSHSAVEQCLVNVVHGDSKEEKKLVAYVILTKGSLEKSEDEIRIKIAEYLQKNLSAAMVPSHILCLKEFPLNANGKIDRKKLPLPIEQESTYETIPPSSKEEEIILSIWREVLGKKHIKVKDNFFAIGGHSLLATQIISRMRKAFSIDIPLATIFENQTVQSLAENIRGLEKNDNFQSLVKLERPVPIPLSFAQQRLWFLDQMIPTKGVYNISFAFELRGELDRQALLRAFEILHQRHESLRTRVASNENGPMQIIEDIASPVPFFELVGNDAYIEIASRAEASYAFDFEKGPLYRICLLQLNQKRFALFITMHHIISDGWSMGLFLKELSALYNGHKKGVLEATLSPLPFQYPDYAVWQRDTLQNEAFDKQLNYWKKALKGIPDLLALPTDYTRPKNPTYQGRVITTKVGHQVLKKLNRLAKEEKASLFMVLLAAFNILLKQYTGQDDIVVGAPVANRHHKEIEGIIGFFVNTLALRTKVHGDETFLEILNQVKRICVEAYDHQDIPFEQLVDYLQVERDLSENPIFQVMLFLQNAEEEEPLHLDGIQIKDLDSYRVISKVDDLTLWIQESPAELSLEFEYATDLFKAETIERIAHHFVAILEAVVRNPGQKVKEYDILTPKEKEVLLVEWNDTQQDYPRHETFISLFEIQAGLTPDKIALECADNRISYKELESASAKVASQLLQAGCKKGEIVGLFMERNISFIVAFIGIMRAGCIYLPLDLKQPEARLIQIIKESRLKWAWSTHEDLPKLRSIAPDLSIFTTGFTTSLPLPHLTPNDLAYIIYTSGSTGIPKGAMVEHQGMLNHMYAKIRDLNMTSDDILAQNAGSTFDISVWQMLTPLILGGRVCIYPDVIAKDPELLMELADHQDVTIIELVPSMMHMILEITDRPLKKMKWIISTGEALTKSLAEKWLQRYPKVPLMNAYGPTECSDDVTHYVIHTPKDIDQPIVPIGRPVQNTQIYLLDEGLRPVPIGVIGELYVGGEGVGRGYLFDETKTNRAFIPNPFGKGRLYKTGDLARYLPDGRILFLGRVDYQIKIRGHRIELGEIEGILSKHPDVDQCLVNVDPRTVAQQDKRIIAYVKLKTQKGINREEIRLTIENHLERNLPQHMIPQVIAFIDNFPLNANGKIDRQQLPLPSEKQEKQVTGPRNNEELLILNIWEAVFNKKRISVQDNFFDIGGHSLIATQVISRIRKAFSIHLPLSAIFEYPSIEKLAQVVAGAKKVNFDVTITKQERLHSIPLSFAQQRLWFLDKLIPKRGVYNIAFAFEISGNLDKSSLVRAFKELHQRHESLRTTIINEENGPIQFISNSDTRIPFMEIVGDESSIDKIRDEEASYPFDLESGPLYRICLLEISCSKFILLWTMHHIISDGWSMGILFNELSQLYNGYKRGQQAPILPQLPLQYSDFSIWQKNYLQNEIFEIQLNYWKKVLEGAPESLSLPTDYSRPSIPSFDGKVYRVKIPNQISEMLKKIGHQEHASLFMVTLASFYILLHRYSGDNDIVVGSPIANRHHKELEGIVGLFVNTLALRMQFSGNETFLDILNRTKKVFVDAYEHQDIPFEQLVDYLKVERDLSKNPVFQVMFIYDNNKGDFPLDELEINETPPALTSAKFDLTLSIIEEDDGLYAEWEYAQDLFTDRSIVNLSHYFLTFLEELTAQPTQLIRNFALNRESTIKNRQLERESSLPFQSLPVLIEAACTKFSSSLALQDAKEKLSYDEMKMRVNQFAHYLLKFGVKKGHLVAINLPRSNDFMIAVLAILKTGAAYLPLDVEQPQNRLISIIQDAKPTICITTSASTIVQNSSQQSLCQFINLDDVNSIINQENRQNLSCHIDSSDLAYVIYTSGSTGTPKGVMVDHGNLNHYIMYAKDTYQSHRGSLLHSSVAFDMMVTVFFGPLISGGSLHILQEGDVDVFLTHMKGNVHYGFLKLTPSKLRLLLAEMSEEELSEKTDAIVLGGEELLEQDIAGFKNCNVDIFNEYGPTEATVGCIVYKLNKQDQFLSKRIPIGKPLNYVQTYVLDQYLQPVPEGVVGELYIGGNGVSQGYLGHPELTEQLFVKYPHLYEMTLYRSGDLVKRLPGGLYEYLGRKDNQIKVSGYRVEVAEIQQNLLKIPYIHACAVIQSENKKLISFIVLKSDSNVQQAKRNIELELKSTLPKFMIPENIIIVDHIPLTPNGKIDSKRLLEDHMGATSMSKKDERLHHNVDRQLAAIWSRILKHPNIDRNDDFFALGGTSLLVLDLIKQIKTCFFKELRPSEIFANRTLAQLSALIKARNIVIEANPIVKIQTIGKSPCLFLIHPGGGLVYRYMDLKHHLPNQQIYGINNPRISLSGEYFSSIEQMAAHYITLIKQVQPNGPYIIGGWSLGGMIAYEMAFQLHKQGVVTSQTILIDSYNLSVFDVPETTPEELIKIIENEGIDPLSTEAKSFSLVLSKNEKISKKYRPPFYEGNVILMKATECVEEDTHFWQDPSNGWTDFAKNMVVLPVQGTHDQLFDPHNIGTLANKLNDAISLADLGARN